MSNRSKGPRRFTPNYLRRERVEGELPPPSARPLPVRRFPTRAAAGGAAGVGALFGLGLYERRRARQLREKDRVVKIYNPFTDQLVEVSKDLPVTGVQSLEARTADGRYANVSHANDATVLHLRMRQHPRSQLVRITRRGGRSGARGSNIGKALVPVPQIGKRYEPGGFGRSSADRVVLADRTGVNAKIPDGARHGQRLNGDVSKGIGSMIGRLVRDTAAPEAGVARSLANIARMPKPTKVPRQNLTGAVARRLAGR